MPENFGQQILAFVPALRAFAMSFCGNRSLADDLVQETITRAWEHRDSYRPDTNMKAWLHTILRNHYFTLRRNAKRTVEDVDGHLTAGLSIDSDQISRLQHRDLRRALSKLPDEQREALILVGAGGFSYEEVADITETSIGTVKSRISRAREKLSKLMEGDSEPQAEADNAPMSAGR